MADIRDVILRKYKIDIREVNIPKLYKITSADISSEELEKKIEERRKKWNQSINGANEKFAERDRAYLEQADKFEAILRDRNLLEQLLAKGSEANTKTEVSLLAKRYFELIHRTSRLTKKEVDFFFKYFPKEKTNRKGIVNFLSERYKVKIKGKDAEQVNDDIIIEEEKNKYGLIENLFSEKTILAIRQCELKQEEAAQNPTILERYPEVRDTMYEFLQMGSFKNPESFKAYIENKKQEVFTVRNEFGTEYLCLVDFFNTMSKVAEFNDVRDNFAEFKLLIMYPALTPYMYEICEVKKDSLGMLYDVAAENYDFTSQSLFLIKYFNVLYDHFGITSDAIKTIMKDAEKQAGRDKIVGAITGIFGLDKGRKLPSAIRMVYMLSFWPIYLLMMMFNIFKAVAENLKYIGIGVGIAMGGGVFAYEILPALGYLKYGLETTLRLNYLVHGNIIWNILGLLQGLILIVTMVGGTIFITKAFASGISLQIRKRVDLIGIQRTINRLIINAKTHTIEQYEQGINLWETRRSLIIGNMVLPLAVIIGCVIKFSIIGA